MSNYIVDGADLTSVANAIRTKGGTSAQLAFPADFVSAIEAISGGGATSPISFNNLSVYFVDVIAGANSVTSFSKVNSYFETLANAPSGHVGFMFAIASGESLARNNTAVCSADAISKDGYRYKNGSYNKVGNINNAGSYDVVIPSGTKYHVIWIELSGV